MQVTITNTIGPGSPEGRDEKSPTAKEREVSHSCPETSISGTPNPENQQGVGDHLRLPVVPRLRSKIRRRIHLYVTTKGSCVHVSPECSTLRGSEVQERAVCQQCASRTLVLH